MKQPVTPEIVREAIDDCLSGINTSLPSVRADVLMHLKGEPKMKKKLSAGAVLAITLMILTMSAAIAAGLGLFGQLGGREHADDRLNSLETVSTRVDQTFTTEDGVTITIDQAYYDGSRVFISYAVEGPFDRLELGEGKPEVAAWDWKLPGETYGQTFGSDSTSHQLMVAHLDGSAPRWATSHYVNVHDGLQIGEEYLDIIGGESYLTEDGRLIGWKECTVPEALAADEVTFLLGTFTTHNTWYQDETGCYLSRGARTGETWHPFTIKRDKTPTRTLTGTAAGAGWSAAATLQMSAIDIKGEIVLSCPQGWVEIERTWENPDGLDYIREWHVYMDDIRDQNGGVEWVSSGVDGQLTFGVTCRLGDAAQEMKLVPVYSRSGENMAEAITLTIAE